MTEVLQKKYIPMTETTYYVLCAVKQPRHGYAIMQFVSTLTESRVRLGTGTLYTMLGRLLDDRLIEIVCEEAGKKTYQITTMGTELALLETRRLAKQLANGQGVFIYSSLGQKSTADERNRI